MKKVAIFTLDMTLNGASKALIEMLEHIDYSKVQIDVYVAIPIGEFMDKFPKEVNVICAPHFSKKEIIKHLFRHPIHLARAVLQKYRLRVGAAKIVECEAVSKRMPIVDTPYDVAISYRHYNVDTFYVINNLHAKKKCFWIHGEITYLTQAEQKILSKYYSKYDRIFPVSQTAKEAFLKFFPNYKDKCRVAYNVIDTSKMYKLADLAVEPEIDHSVPAIVSIGRIAPEKGYTLVVEACSLLKQRNHKFKWYIIGDGKDRTKIEDLVQQYNLSDMLLLKGALTNPYRYLKECDIYVQTSLSESYCLTLSEARAFRKPIVTTDIPAAREQLVPEKNALFADCTAQSLANQIERLLVNPDLCAKFTNHLSLEDPSNMEVIDIFMEEIGA